MADYRADTSSFAVYGSHIKWVGLRLQAVHDRSFVLKRAKGKLGLVLWLFGRLLMILPRLFEVQTS
jgi:hypothetical protein